MTLSDGPRGVPLVIVGLADNEAEKRLLPFGLMPGSVVVIQERLPGGPVVVKRGRQELALGHRLARRLQVRPQL